MASAGSRAFFAKPGPGWPTLNLRARRLTQGVWPFPRHPTPSQRSTRRLNSSKRALLIACRMPQFGDVTVAPPGMITRRSAGVSEKRRQFMLVGWGSHGQLRPGDGKPEQQPAGTCAWPLRAVAESETPARILRACFLPTSDGARSPAVPISFPMPSTAA